MAEEKSALAAYEMARKKKAADKADAKGTKRGIKGDFSQTS